MKDKLVECVMCRHRFIVKIFEPGEAERKGIPGFPILCERCGEEIREVR